MTPWTAYRKLQLIANGGAVALGMDWWRKAAKEGCDRIAELEVEVDEWRHCAKYDPKMSGQLLFTGLDRRQFDRCRKRFIERLGP